MFALLSTIYNTQYVTLVTHIFGLDISFRMLIIMIEFCITVDIFLCSDHMTLLEAFEGWKDANRNEKILSPCK